MIEDDEAVGSLFRAILNRSAIEFRKHTLRGGIRRFRDAPADLVVTDMEMFQGDGAELIQQSRAEHPTLEF